MAVASPAGKLISEQETQIVKRSGAYIEKFKIFDGKILEPHEVGGEHINKSMLNRPNPA